MPNDHSPVGTVRIVAVAILVVTVSTQPLFLLATAAPQIGRDLGFGPAELGLFTAAFFLTASAVSAAAGRRVEVIGWQNAMRISIIGGSAVLALIATVVEGVPLLLAMLLLGAAVYGFANPSANQALAALFPPSRQGLLFGIKHAGIPTSILLAGLAVPTLMLRVGWRWGFGVMALLAVGVLVLVPSSRTRSPLDRGVQIEDEARLALTTLRLQALAAALAVSTASALGTFGASAAVDQGISEAGAGYLIFAGGLASIVARVGVGLAVDRAGSDGFRQMSLLISLGTVTTLVLALSTGGVFGVALVIAYATAWGWPGLMTFSVVRTNPFRPAAATAVVQAGVFIGAGIAPLAFGSVVERASYRVAWLLVGFTLLMALVVLEIVRRRVVARV